MKNILIICLLIASTQACAKKIKVDYEPRGVIVGFILDGCSVYTDTTALLQALNDDSTYNARLRNLIKRKLIANGNDTVVFNGEVVDFEAPITHLAPGFNAESLVVRLTKIKKVKIYDRYGNLVTKIKTKRVRRKFEGSNDHYVMRVYYAQHSKSNLFEEGLTPRIYYP